MFTYFAQYYRQPIMHDSSTDWVSGLFMLVCLGVLVGGIILVVRLMTGSQAGTSVDTKAMQRSPLDIARERYAKGEITKDDLAEIRKELSKDQ